MTDKLTDKIVKGLCAPIDRLGLVWSDLMGQRPMNSDPFRGFVDDAWASLGGGPDESFDRAIVKVTRGFRS